MSVQALSWVIEKSESTRGARCVMFAIANHADEYGGNCWASVETLARESRLSERGTQYALRQLIESGELEQTGESPFGTRVYRIRGVQETTGGVQEPAEIVSEVAPKPSLEPSKESNSCDEVEEVFAHYLSAFPNKRQKKADEGQRKVIRNALKVATADELKRCIDACACSDWHQRRGEHENRAGGKHNSLSLILAPKSRGANYPSGRTQREQIDYWLARESKGGMSGEERERRIEEWVEARNRYANGEGPDPGATPWEKESTE